MFRNVVMSDGLSGLLVNAIYKDPGGFIRSGIDNGLDRFDGAKVKHFGFRGVDSGRKKRVNCITETDSKQLWIGNGTGLWRLNRSDSELQKIVPEKIDCTVNALSAGGDVLHIGTERGLFIQKDGQLLQVQTNKSMLAVYNRVMDLCPNEDKSVLRLAIVQGLFPYPLKDGQVNSWHFRENILGADYFRCLIRIGETLYLGTMSQGVVYSDIPKQIFAHMVSLGCDVILDISGDGEETVYITIDGNGVHFLSHKDRKVVRCFFYDMNDKEGIRSNSIYSLLVDDRGAVRVGHFQTGLDYSLYQSGPFRTYAYPPQLNSANLSIRSFVNQGSEKVIGSRDGLFYINEAAGIMKSSIKPVLTSDLVLTICFYEGEYYIGMYGGGTTVLNPQTLSLKYFTQGDTELFQKGHTFCVKPDNRGNLWTGTSQRLFCYNGQVEQIRNFTSTNSQLPEGNVYEVSLDSTGKGWIVTEAGMCIYDPALQNPRSNVPPEGFVHKDKIRTIHEDVKHNLYFIREKGSLLASTLTMGHLRSQSVLSTLSDNSLMSITEDNQGRLWIGCNDGLSCIKEEGEGYDSFTFNDGVSGPTFTNGAAYKDERGLLRSGSIKRLICVDPKQVDEVRGKVRPIVFTDILANGISINKSSLKYGQNNLIFCFIDPTYGLPSVPLYEYKLEGADNDQKLLTAQSEVLYYGLSSGTYTLYVRIPGNEQSMAIYKVTAQPMIPRWGWVILVMPIILIVVLVRYYVRKFASLVTEVHEISSEEEEEEEKTAEPHPAEERYKANRMNEAECEELYDRLVAYVEKERSHINPGLKMEELVATLHTSSYSLSYLLNQYLNRSYYDFINEHWVAQLEEMVEDGDYSRYTLTALAELCGFSPRASFFRSFKKSTGVIPNEYIRSIRGTARDKQ